LDDPLPLESQWLFKYFRSDIRKAFLCYFLSFGSSVRFREHSGFHCSERYLKSMKSDLKELQKAHDKFKSDLDFESLAKMEMGDYFD
jgi:hypothetical protein